MAKSSESAEFHQECFNCPLPDCLPRDPKCPVRQKKAAEKGEVIPTKRKYVMKCATRPILNIAPQEYVDRQDYHRQYNAAYNETRKMVVIRALRIRKDELALVKAYFHSQGKTLHGELMAVIQGMVRDAKNNH